MDDALMLRTIYLDVIVGSASQTTYQSKDFAKVTTKPYSMLVLDPSAMFIELKSMT